MKSIYGLLSLILVSILALAGCASKAETQNISPEDQLNSNCQDLRYQLIKNTTNASGTPENQGLNPADEARIYKDYDRLNCDTVIANQRAKGTF